MQGIEATASSHSVQPTAVPVRTTADIEPALESFARQPNGGLMLTTNAFTDLRTKLIADLAIRYHLPSISIGLDFPKNGGLMRYSPSIDVADQFPRAASTSIASLRARSPAIFRCKDRPNSNW
jgi:putative ABC transport system substrate-binding protein